MRKFLIFIVLFFSKIFIIKCESRKVRLYLFFGGSLYRYFSEKNDEYDNFKDTDDIEELNTDYKIEDNILDLKEIYEKIKSKQIIFKNGSIDIYDKIDGKDIDDKEININNYKITSLKLLSDEERKAFTYIKDKGKLKKLNWFEEKELKKNFHQYKIEDLNKKVKIPDSVNFVYIYIEDFSKSDLFKKGAIKHLSLINKDKGVSHFFDKENFIDIDDIKIYDLYKNLKYIEKYDYYGNSQILQLLIDKLLNDNKYKKLEFNFFDLTKEGKKKFKIEDLKKMGVFVYDICLGSENSPYSVNLDNNDMYLTCFIKFKRKVKIIFYTPENTELDLGLGMKQEAEIKFTSFSQNSIEDSLADTINKIFSNKSRLKNGHTFKSNKFWDDYEGIWPEKYEIENEKGETIYTFTGYNNSNYLDITNEDNLTFKIYLKPGSELLKGIHVKLHFEPVAGKFVSEELEKMPKNTNIIYRTGNDGTVFLNKGENYIEQIKNILKEGYFNKQKISLDDNCYDLYLKDNEGTKETPLTNNNQLHDDDTIYIVFNNNAINKYIKDNKNDPDPVYYGKDDQRTNDKIAFDEKYEYDYTYKYQQVTGNFENYYNYFNKINSEVKYINKDDNPEYGNPNYTPITTPEDEEKNHKIPEIGCCTNCMKCYSYKPTSKVGN